tara:strand:- start:676 stop:1080 length:405 start_codon:yes stop_codon:yes gene_type:complete
MGDVSKNFSIKEFKCKCSKCEMPKEVLSNIELLVVQLQSIRDHVGASVTINSAYRCQSHNSSVGGSKRSQHLLGKAADITIKGYNPDSVVCILRDMLTNPYLKGIDLGAIGMYDTFTHIDIRDNNEIVIWDNRK